MKQFLLIVIFMTSVVAKAQQWSSLMALSSGHRGVEMDEDSSGNMYVYEYGVLSGRNSQANILWQIPHENCLKVVTGFGRVFTLGYLDSTHSIGNVFLTSTGDRDGFIACLDLQGNVVWTRQLSGAGSDLIKSIKILSSNELLITFENSANATFNGQIFQKGVSVCRLDFQGNTLQDFTIKYRGDNISVNHIESGVSGNIYLLARYSDSIFAGNSSFMSGNSYHGMYYMTKFDEFGNLLWLKELSGCYKREINIFAIDDYENIYYVCSETYGLDKLIKLDINGNELWRKQSGGSLYGKVNDLKIDKSNNVLLTGSTWVQAIFENFTINGNESFLYVAKFDSIGNCLWALKAQSNVSCEGYVLCVKTQYITIAGSAWELGITTAGNFSVNSYNFIGKIQTNGSMITHLNDHSNKYLNVHPNPSSGIINFSSAKESSGKYYITNLSGQKIEEGQYTSGKLDLLHLPKGVYILVLNRSKSGKKIILQ